MAVPTLLELAESGAHFGHNRSLVYPKARHFIFGIRNNVALINLEKTIEGIKSAQKMLKEALESKKAVLVVGTKNSIRSIVEEISQRHNVSYIAERWFGGTLTNFETIIGNIRKMNDLELFLASEKATKLSKKERLGREHRLARYKRFLGGLSALNRMPDLIVLASASADKIAIGEANQLGIPTIAITDTDVDPNLVTVAVPGNDDAPKAVRLILEAIFSSETPEKESLELVKPKPKKVVEKPKKTTKTTKKSDEKADKKPATKAVKKTTKKTTKKEE